MSKEKDPNEGLADDAVLATDLGDEAEREAEQLSYYGGDPADDTDDLTALDRGDSVGEEDATEEEKDDEESEDSDEKSDDEEDADDADKSSDEAEDEDADDSDQEDSESAEDDGDEDDVEDEEEEEEEDKPEPKDKGIPRSRFNEVNTRMKNAEAEIARLQAVDNAKEDAAVEKFDFDKAEDDYMALLLDGKTKDAGQKRREIREAEKAEFKAEAVAESTSTMGQDAIEKSLDSLTKEAENMFPIFNESSDDFNPEAVSKTLTFMRGYQAEGLKADDAFVAAVADMMEMYDLGTEQQSDDVPKKKGKKVTKKAPIVKTKEKIKTAKQQAQTPAGEGQGSDEAGAVVPDIEQMTDEEIDALPEKTLARMRGDFVG